MSLKTDIQLGDPPGIQVSLSDNPYVLVNAKQTDKGLLDCVSENLEHRSKINLGLSGGIDSQFSLQCCLHLNKEITVYTYRSFWQETILNSEDVYIAEQLCKEYNLTHNIIDIDLKDFYDKLTHFKYSTNFFNSSPQLSVHFYFIDRLKQEFDIDHIMLGGDPTLFKYAPITSKNFRLSGEGFYQDHMAPYYLFCDSIGIECLRDITYHSPQGVYASFKNNLDIVKNKKIFITNDKHYKDNPYVYKFEYYKNVFPNIKPQVVSTTGFENLKKILAMESGTYNQFDILYRFPQMDLVPKTLPQRAVVNKNKEQLSSILNRMRNVKYDPLLKSIYSEYIDYVEQNNLQDVSQYKFDF